MKCRNIVVLNFTRMGDLVQSTPLLRQLRESQRDARLSLLVQSEFSEAANHLPMIDSVIEFDSSQFVGAVDREKGSLQHAHGQLSELLSDHGLQEIDLLINLSHTGRSATLGRLLNPSNVIGICRDTHGHRQIYGAWIQYLFAILEDRRLNPFNLVEIYQRLYPANPYASRLEFKLNPDDVDRARHLLRANGLTLRNRIIALQPGASHPSRCWPETSYLELAIRLHERGFDVVILGSVEEKSLSERIAQRSRRGAVSLAGKTSIPELAAVLSLCEKLISNDTGTLHVATAVNTQVIGIYLGPASAKDTAPYGSDHLIIESDVACAPCDYRNACAHSVCGETVTTEQVMQLFLGNPLNTKLCWNMEGVRIFRTNVDRSGRFTLQALSNAAGKHNRDLLDFYRVFWDRLLSNHVSKDFAESIHDVSKTALSGGLSELMNLAQAAADAVADLRNLEIAHPDEQTLRKTLNRQLGWQNCLRDMIHKHPETALVTRFLLVNAVLARATNPRDYRRDLGQVVSTMHQASYLLDKMISSEPKRVTNEVCGA